MVDFHTHVLPGIDDGSANPDMTKEMLLEEYSQGVDHVVATPHFYADHTSVRHFLDSRQTAFAKVEALRKEMGDGTLPRITLGAEVYYFPGMGTAKQLSELTIGESGTILLEMPFEQWTESIFRDVREIIEKQRLRVVLAHIERYVDFQKDSSIWKRVFDLPVVPQINTGSFLKHKTGLFRKDRRRQFAMDFLKEHPALILGSDCHNLSGRKPNLKQGRDAIEAELGREALEKIDAATREVLT